ncbi:EAL domain-containing protein [Oceanicoccus sp. KOV_DT_Chl]|uniref:EAL domain-containing protein n=1 Tax=Oceanicoccus sp. KOV_DT_Chl TaxID=1904639 RepID=UPI002714B87D|nr:EAL domain-containing protein [Oceanicoccus sp. KOV_DT_Chl]
MDILTCLHLKGLGLSIDYFGTGFSSLSLLHKVPFTELKIGKSFIQKTGVRLELTSDMLTSLR